MRYFKLITYTTGGEFETHEKLIDEPTFRQYQKAMIEGKDFLVLEDRIIKRNMIKEILPADADVKEYLAQGTSLKTLGLPENPKLDERYHPALESGKAGQIGGKNWVSSKYEEMKRVFSDKTEISPEIRTAAEEDGAREERKANA